MANAQRAGQPFRIRAVETAVLFIRGSYLTALPHQRARCGVETFERERIHPAAHQFANDARRFRPVPGS